MASIFTHPAIPVGMLMARVKPLASRRLLFFAIILTILPDADVISFKFGISYHSQWGHRGFTHSIFFALIMGALGALLSEKLQASKKSCFSWCFISTLSHAVLDALTNGGLGVAFFWPLSQERFFFPWRVIQVSPIGVTGFFSWWGLKVIGSEICFVWLPVIILSKIVKKVKTISLSKI